MPDMESSQTFRWVALGPGRQADASGQVDATEALQAWIDGAAPGATLALPAGVYRVGRPLWIRRPLTLTTRGHEQSRAPIRLADDGSFDPGPYACLRAGPELRFGSVWPHADQDLGLLCLGPPGPETDEPGPDLEGVELHHLILDGNARERCEAAGTGATCDQFNCTNLHARRCRNLCVRHCLSTDGCVRGNDPYANLFADCPGLRLIGNVFHRHGDVPVGPHAPGHLGSTLASNSLEIQCVRGDVRDVQVVDNLIYDPSNLGLVLRPWAGRVMTGEVARNRIVQVRNMNWGAMLLLYGEGSFGDGTRLDPRTTLLVHHNQLEGNAAGAVVPGTRTPVRMAPFGIQVGTRPYGPAHPDPAGPASPGPLTWRVRGGRIFANTIAWTQFGVNVDGAGTPEAPVVVVDNRVGPGVGLAFNRAAWSSAAPGSGNTLWTNAHLSVDAAGVTRQAGPLVRVDERAPGPEGWGAWLTHEECAWGTCPAVLAVAPKAVESPGYGPPNPAVAGGRRWRQRLADRVRGWSRR